MRRLKFSVVLLAGSAALLAHGADPSAGKGESAYLLNLDAPAAKTPAEGKPFPLVLAWLAQNVPECPPAVAPEIAAKFIEQLALGHPGEAERLGAGEVPLRAYESLLWQTAALRLKGPDYESLRAQLAVRRIGALLVQQGAGDPARAEVAASRLKNESAAAYRRLTEGRMEDEEIARLPGFVPDRDPAREAAAIVAKPKILSAQEIAGEFARRNQVGAAAARLRAYLVEADLHTADGKEQQLQLFKLRPGLFRVHLRTAGQELQVVAFDGTRYWGQVGPRIEQVNPASLGALRYLSEFIDPLFEAEGRTFERLDDAVVDGRKCYRLRLVRPDGPGYVALVDQENYQQVARENPDGSRTRYGDFRDFAGLTIAYREELVLANGQVARMEIRRVVPNPGLIAAFFAAPAAGQLDLGPLEQVLAKNSRP